MTDPYLTPLDRDALARHGIPEGWTFGIRDRVRFHELDALNHVNNATYFSWFETFRIPYLKDRGVTGYGPADPMLVLKEVEARFHAPMHLGEDYIVTGRTVSFRRTSFRMEYVVFSGGLRVEGSALIVLLNRDDEAKFPLSDAMKAAFRAKDGATDQAT